MVSHMEMNKRLDFDFSELYHTITFLLTKNLE
jgi:hypothetical protein